MPALSRLLDLLDNKQKATLVHLTSGGSVRDWATILKVMGEGTGSSASSVQRLSNRAAEASAHAHADLAWRLDRSSVGGERALTVVDGELGLASFTRTWITWRGSRTTFGSRVPSTIHAST
jgi:hypothetical protein